VVVWHSRAFAETLDPPLPPSELPPTTYPPRSWALWWFPSWVPTAVKEKTFHSLNKQKLSRRERLLPPALRASRGPEVYLLAHNTSAEAHLSRRHADFRRSSPTREVCFRMLLSRECSPAATLKLGQSLVANIAFSLSLYLSPTSRETYLRCLHIALTHCSSLLRPSVSRPPHTKTHRADLLKSLHFQAASRPFFRQSVTTYQARVLRGREKKK
jgi:hypothetical protein